MTCRDAKFAEAARYANAISVSIRVCIKFKPITYSVTNGYAR